MYSANDTISFLKLTTFSNLVYCVYFSNSFVNVMDFRLRDVNNNAHYKYCTRYKMRAPRGNCCIFYKTIVVSYVHLCTRFTVVLITKLTRRFTNFWSMYTYFYVSTYRDECFNERIGIFPRTMNTTRIARTIVYSVAFFLITRLANNLRQFYDNRIVVLIVWRRLGYRKRVHFDACDRGGGKENPIGQISRKNGSTWTVDPSGLHRKSSRPPDTRRKVSWACLRRVDV